MQLFFKLLAIVLAVGGLSSCDKPKQRTSPAQLPTDYQVLPSQNTTDNRTQAIPVAELSITSPKKLILTATGELTPVNLPEPQVKNAVGAVTVSNNAPAEGFPVGSSIITWVATDQVGRQATTTQQIMVDASVACGTSDLFFRQRIWPLVEGNCLECHINNIVESQLNFVDAKTTDYFQINNTQLEKMSALKDGSGMSLVLSKLSNQNNSHVGGEIFTSGSPEYNLFANMMARYAMCTAVQALPAEMILPPPLQQLRKITLALASRLPTEQEIQQLKTASSPRQRISLLIDAMFNEDAFYQRLNEIYNDLLLTNAFAINGKALSLDLKDFDNSKYFDNLALMQQGYNGTDSNRIRRAANHGISHAPLALIEYVVRNDFPFTEILLADYVMVNPYSATIFNAVVPGQPMFQFSYGDNVSQHDENQFVPARLSDASGRNLSHAGVLTTLPFLSRYPSSNTNVNRKRARYVFAYFLGVDIEGLANRSGLNLDNVIGQFPTLQDPQCKVCHDVLDPVAGLFKNWSNKGRFLGNNQNWFDVRQPAEMLAPGINGQLLPSDQGYRALQWLANQIASDDRFVTKTVATIFQGFTGIKSRMDAGFLQTLKEVFVSSNYNLKVLVKKIILDERFLASNATQYLLASENNTHGTAQLLSPERLDGKISAIFPGVQWRSPSKRTLLSTDSYRLLYGGIDSIDVIHRTTQATSLIAGVQMRIANQLSCELVPLDFSRQKNQRQLFPFVEINHLPGQTANDLLIQQNIQYLFQKILGESLSVNDADVLRVFDLFVAARNYLDTSGVVKECQGDLSAENEIITDANKTVRAWMAVVNFMLRSYQFLYE